MPELRRISPISDWFEVEVKSPVVPEAQKIRLRVKPVMDIEMVDTVVDGKTKPSEILLARALDAIQAWDLEENGVPIPCTDEQKKRLDMELRLLLSSYTAGGERFVATAIIEKAQAPEDFLKN